MTLYVYRLTNKFIDRSTVLDEKWFSLPVEANRIYELFCAALSSKLSIRSTENNLKHYFTACDRYTYTRFTLIYIYNSVILVSYNNHLDIVIGIQKLSKVTRDNHSHFYKIESALLYISAFWTNITSEKIETTR